MSGTQGTKYSQLPPLLALDGNELVCISVPTGDPTPFVSYYTTTYQIAALLTPGGVGSCSMRQLIAALSFQGQLNNLFDALPADINNQYNIAYWHAYRMTQSDPFITAFLQPTLGYNSAQVEILFALAVTYPV